MGGNPYQFGTSPIKLEPNVIKREKKPNVKVVKDVPRQQIKISKGQRKKQLKITVTVAGIFLLLLTISCRNSQIDKKFNQIQSQKKELAAIQKENEQLEVNIESSINLTNIEKEASEKLGMQKPTNEQKVYVSLPKKDYVQPTIEDNLKEKKNNNWVKAMINTVLGK